MQQAGQLVAKAFESDAGYDYAISINWSGLDR
jgi:hypothetical protein